MFLIMLSLVISLIIVIFALQNSSMVPIVFFNWSSEIPLVVLIFASVFAGATIIFLLALWKDVKRKFNKVSAKTTEYKSIINTKKEALTERLERKKSPEENITKADCSNEIDSTDDKKIGTDVQITEQTQTTDKDKGIT